VPFPDTFLTLPFTSIINLVIYSCHLVRLGSSLAGLELLKVPVADLHVATVLVHALREALRGTGAVVSPLLLLGALLGLLRLSLDLLGRGAAAEETADRVADGRAHRHTTITCQLRLAC
jgi:hypothetical protein